MSQYADYKDISEFHAGLVQRWLDGKCSFWALNNQFDIINTKKQRKLDKIEMKKDMKK